MDTQIEVFTPKWKVFPVNWRDVLSKNIRHERKRLDISQATLAKKMGIQGGDTVSNWERGKGGFNIDTLVLLGEYLERSPNELLTKDLSGSPPPKVAPLSIEHGDGISDRGGGGASSPAAAESPPAALAAEMKALQKTVYEAVLKMGQLQEAVEHQGSNFDK